MATENWSAVVSEVVRSGDRIEVAVKLSNGAEGWLQRYVMAAGSLTLAALKAQVLATIAGHQAFEGEKLSVAPGTEIDLTVEPVEDPPPVDQKRADFLAAKGEFDIMTRLVSAGLATEDDLTAAQNTLKAAYIPAYRELI